MKKSTDLVLDDLVNSLKEDDDLLKVVFQKNKDESYANIITKNSGIVCGLKHVQTIYRKISSKVKVNILKEDGEYVGRGVPLCRIDGPINEILKGEKLALSFVGLMCGIATQVNKYIIELQGTKMTLKYAEKSLPGLDDFCKEAFISGGGTVSSENQVLLTRNALTKYESIDQLISIIKVIDRNVKFIVEVSDEDEMADAIDSKCHIIRVVSNKELVIEKLAEMGKGRKTLELYGDIDSKLVRHLSMIGYSSVLIPSLSSCGKLLPVDLCFYKRIPKK